jgi:hypothetical protein
MMKRAAGMAVMFAAVGIATSEPLMNGHKAAPSPLHLQLSGLDFVPGDQELGQVGADPAQLRDIAGDGAEDPGVRLRAYRALGLFGASPEARFALEAGITRYRNADRGIELLYLIAAAEALGQIAGPTDVPTIGPLLDAPSRDLRLGVARALGRIADPQACALLTRRSMVEQVPQVLIAINEAASVCP